MQELQNITGLNIKELTTLVNNTSYDSVAAMFNKEMFEQMCLQSSLHKLFSDTFHMRSYPSLPLQLSNGESFIFGFYSRKADTYNADHIGLLNHLQKSMTVGIESMLSIGKENKTIVPKTNDYSEAAENSITAKGFEGIIGRSHLLLNVFDLVTQVAPTDTSVLILGESGTGKERVADCTHNLSPRRSKPFVKVNCAALPSH